MIELKDINLSDIEKEIFQLFCNEKIGYKYSYNKHTGLENDLLKFGFIFFCINNGFKIIEKKISNFYALSQNYSSYYNILKILYKNYYDREENIYELENFDSQIDDDLEFILFYRNSNRTTYVPKNDFVLNTFEFICDCLPDDYKYFLLDKYNIDFTNKEEKEVKSEYKRYEDLIIWTKNFIEENNKKGGFNKIHAIHIYTEIKNVLDKPYYSRYSDEYEDECEDDLPF